MNKYIIKNLIESIKHINYEIPDLNRGGCGIFALYLAEALQKEGVECEIVIIGYSCTTDTCELNSRVYDTRDHCIENNQPFTALSLLNMGLSLYHILLKVKTPDNHILYIDSNGAYEKIEDKFSLGIEAICDIETFKPIVKSRKGWNKCYDRTHNKEIFKIINEALNEIAVYA